MLLEIEDRVGAFLFSKDRGGRSIHTSDLASCVAAQKQGQLQEEAWMSCRRPLRHWPNLEPCYEVNF